MSVLWETSIPIIKGSVQCRNDFEATIVYIQDQLAALATKHAGKRSVAFAKKKEITSDMRKWIKSSLGISGPKAAVEVMAEVVEAKAGRGGRGGRGGDREETGTEFDPKNLGKYLNKRAWFKLSEEQMELSRNARKENPPKKSRKVSALSTASISAAISGARSDQVKDLAARKAAAVASVKVAKDGLEDLDARETNPDG